MARTFNSGTPDYLESDQPIVTAAPFTISIWFKTTNLVDDLTLFAIGPSSDSSVMWRLVAEGATGGDPVGFRVADGASNPVARSTVGYSSGVWQHAAAVEASSSSHSVYLNGGNKDTSTTTSAPAGSNRTRIGARTAGGANGMDGQLGHAAVWSVALSDQEILALAKGVSPLRLRRAALIGYWPIAGVADPERNLLQGAVNMFANGSPAKAEAPPIPDAIPVG